MEIFKHPADKNMCPYPRYGSLSLTSVVAIDGASKPVRELSLKEARGLIEQRHGIRVEDILKPIKKDITRIHGTELNLGVFVLLYMEGMSPDDLIEEMRIFDMSSKNLYSENIHRYFERHASDKCAERRKCLHQARQMHRLWEYYTNDVSRENQTVLEEFLGGVTFGKLVDLFEKWKSNKKGHGRKEGLFLALDALAIVLSGRHLSDYAGIYNYAYKRFVKAEVRKRVKAYVRDRKSKISLV